MSKPLLVLCTVPDEECGRRIAGGILERRLAACVTVGAEARSLFRWKGKISCESEHILFIKTTAVHYSALETHIREEHPYEVPEIIALPIAEGLPSYLDWIEQETAAE